MANRVKGEGGYDKHGNYIRFRITINGKSKEFFGKTKKEAHDKYLRYIEENPDGKAVAKKLTFGDCAEKWYREIKSKEGISYKSRRNYELYVGRIKESVLGKTNLVDVDADLINKYFRSADVGKLKKLTYPKAVIKNTLAYAVDNDYIDKNPYDKVKIPKRQSAKIKVFSKNDVSKIIEFAKADDEFGLAILILLYTGLRRGELCALNWKDIDLDEGSIYIHQAVSTDEGGSYLKSTTKTDKDRLIAIPAPLFEALQNSKNKKGCVIAPKQKFCKLQDFDNAYDRFFRRLNHDRDELDKIQFLSAHKMRHTFATYTFKGSKDLLTVKNTLGHTTVRTTEIYTHVDIGDMRKSVEQIAY